MEHLPQKSSTQSKETNDKLDTMKNIIFPFQKIEIGKPFSEYGLARLFEMSIPELCRNFVVLHPGRSRFIQRGHVRVDSDSWACFIKAQWKHK